MSKKAFFAILIALALPVGSYFIINHYKDTAISMPRYYLPDSIRSKETNGKYVSDTLWHQLRPFNLTNQLGEKVTLDKYKNKIIIADFFFTNCPTICPQMTKNMKRLQESITNAQRVGDKTNHYVQFVSFSVDPERDSVARLKDWADRFQINPEQWDLLTGDKKMIYDIALSDLKLAVVDGGKIDSNFVHSDRFVLIDSMRNVRGYYHGLDSASLAELSNDLVLLTLEKNKNGQNALAKNIKMMATIFVITIAAVGLFLILFKPKKNA